MEQSTMADLNRIERDLENLRAARADLVATLPGADTTRMDKSIEALEHARALESQLALERAEAQKKTA
jgi:phage shock protein A